MSPVEAPQCGKSSQHQHKEFGSSAVLNLPLKSEEVFKASATFESILSFYD